MASSRGPASGATMPSNAWDRGVDALAVAGPDQIELQAAQQAAGRAGRPDQWRARRQSGGTRPAGPGAGWSSGWWSGGVSSGPSTKSSAG